MVIAVAGSWTLCLSSSASSWGLHIREDFASPDHWQVNRQSSNRPCDSYPGNTHVTCQFQLVAGGLFRQLNTGASARFPAMPCGFLSSETFPRPEAT